MASTRRRKKFPASVKDNRRVVLWKTQMLSSRSICPTIRDTDDGSISRNRAAAAKLPSCATSTRILRRSMSI